jgi:hypothetical protein
MVTTADLYDGLFHDDRRTGGCGGRGPSSRPAASDDAAKLTASDYYLPRESPLQGR